MSAAERAAGAQGDHVDEVDRLALELDRAELDRVGLRPLTKRPSGVTRDEAWRIASARDRLRAARGEVRTGYKLGWTSEAMRRALGVDEPNFGTLWAYMRVDDGVLDLARLIHPKAEPEVAFVADVVLQGAGITADDVVGGGRWAVAVEVVDPRWTAWDFDWLDNTADGSSAAAYVVGAFHSPGVRPETFRLTMEAGAVTREGTGEAAMGSPAEAVAYLVRQLHDRQEALQPGMVVLTGGITAPIDLTAGLRVRVSSPELGSCDLRCR
jgi:2-keto-4-pentenoate hydratase